MATKRAASKSKGKKAEGDKKNTSVVRGGSVCDPKARGAHIIRGSGTAAICKLTSGKDQRPRWHAAGK